MAEKSDKIKQILDDLEEGVKSLRNSDKWKELMRTMAKFPTYSYRNNLWLMIQAAQTGKELSCVMSYTGWPKVERHVVSGAKAFQILCPCFEKRTVQSALKDRDGNALLDENGQQKVEQKEIQVPRFKIANVFDVSQTEGKPLPEMDIHLLDGTVGEYETVRQALTEISPVPIDYEKVEGGANGYYSPLDKRIVVDIDLPERHKVHTLVHEIAHAMQFSDKLSERNRHILETEAESVAFVLMCHIMGDTVTEQELGQYSFPYLASWAADDDLSDFKHSLQNIQKMAATMIAQLDAKVEEIKQLNCDRDRLTESINQGETVHHSSNTLHM